MKSKISAMRKWVSLLMLASFLVLSVSGLLMIFSGHGKESMEFYSAITFIEKPGHLVKEIHEWFGIAFIAMGLLHLIYNQKPLIGYFRQI